MILADENVAAAVIQRLRRDGLDVVSVAEVAPRLLDGDVLSLAVADGRILLTDDKDFGELVVRERRPHCGVVLLRLAGLTLADRADLVSSLFHTEGLALRNAFTVLDADGRVRTRRMASR